MLGSERDVLIFLKAKARDSKMYSLLSATLLNEAKLSLATVSALPQLEHDHSSSLSRVTLFHECSSTCTNPHI
jgi:anaphase-promoting complex subunit 5